MVEYVASPNEIKYRFISMYPSSFPDGVKKVGSIKNLVLALTNGKIVATGYRVNGCGERTIIPAQDWPRLQIVVPDVYDASEAASAKQPWTGISLISADLKRLWRGTDERLGRSKFDWEGIQSIYEDVLNRNPDFSRNSLIEEMQLEYQDRFSKEPPSRSTIQRKIKTWT